MHRRQWTVWLLAPSYRDLEDILAERGIDVSEAIRRRFPSTAELYGWHAVDSEG